MGTPISRRQFFRLRPRATLRLIAEQLRGGGEGGSGEDAAWTRPPGALRPDSRFVAACERCKACSDACPHDVIAILGADAGTDEGTPVLNVLEQPCHWCSDFPCVAACPSGALVREAERQPPAITRVTLRAEDCLNARGTLCDDCAAICPTHVRAIRSDGRSVEVNADRCTGCGLCVEICPARPNAFHVSAIAD